MSSEVSRPPKLVDRAVALARDAGFGRSCSLETGMLLHALAASVREGTLAEIGSGCGVGSAWMVSALRPEVSFITVEADEQQAALVEALLASLQGTRVIRGDWRELLAHGPFALLFVDAAPAKRDHPEIALESLQPGGMVVLDDLTPGRTRLDDEGKIDDPVREFWLHDPRLIATEIMVSETEAVILAVRR